MGLNNKGSRNGKKFIDNKMAKKMDSQGFIDLIGRSKTVAN